MREPRPKEKTVRDQLLIHVRSFALVVGLSAFLYLLAWATA
jgi:hypothetical protein